MPTTGLLWHVHVGRPRPAHAVLHCGLSNGLRHPQGRTRAADRVARDAPPPPPIGTRPTRGRRSRQTQVGTGALPGTGQDAARGALTPANNVEGTRPSRRPGTVSASVRDAVSQIRRPEGSDFSSCRRIGSDFSLSPRPDRPLCPGGTKVRAFVRWSARFCERRRPWKVRVPRADGGTTGCSPRAMRGGELGPSRIGVHRSVHRHLVALQPRIGQQRVDHLGRAGLTLLRSGRSSRSGTPTWPPASASATCSTTASPTSTDGSPHSRPSVSPSPRCGRRRPAPTKPPALRAGLQLAPADLDE